MNSQRSVLKRIFLAAWRLVDGARKVFLNLVFFFLLYLVIAGLLDFDESLILHPDTALVLQPQRDVVEEYSGTPLDFALQQATETGRTETRLRDLTDAVRRAADDERIVRLVIDPDYLSGVGLASLQELEAAIAEFRAAGKPVVALADTLNQQQYYFAALADVQERGRIEQLKARLDAAVEHLIRLVAIFVVQTVLLPLLFVGLLGRVLSVLLIPRHSS